MRVTLTNRLSAAAAHGQPSVPGWASRPRASSSTSVAPVAPRSASTTTRPWASAARSRTTGGSRPRRACSSSRTWPRPRVASTTPANEGSGCTAPSPSSRPARCGPTRAAAPSCRAPRASPPRRTRRQRTRAASSTSRPTSIHRAHRRSARASSWPRTRSRASAWASTTAPSRCPPARPRRAPTASARRPGSRPGRTATLPSSSSPADPGRGCRPPTASRKESEDCGLAESCYVSNVMHTYTGDATKIRFGLAGVKETHVFHLHAHQWLADPRGDAVTGEGPDAKPESTTIDSQSFGPGEAFSAELLYGAGSTQRDVRRLDLPLPPLPPLRRGLLGADAGARRAAWTARPRPRTASPSAR